MKKYFIAFGTCYAITTAIAAILGQWLATGASTNIVALMAAGFLVAGKFVKDQGRVPTRPEKHKLVWGSLAMAALVSFVLAAAYFGGLASPEEAATTLQTMRSVPAWAWLVGALIATVLYALVLYACYGWYAGIVARKDARP